MGELIRGWKRKAGLTTLLLACVLTAMWLRSLNHWDLISIKTGKCFTHSLYSDDSRLNWLRVYDPPYDRNTFLPIWSGGAGPLMPRDGSARHDFLGRPKIMHYLKCEWRIPAYASIAGPYESSEALDTPDLVMWSIRYDQFVVLLLFISAWLLLISGRQPSRSQHLPGIPVSLANSIIEERTLTRMEKWKRNARLVRVPIACFLIGWFARGMNVEVSSTRIAGTGAHSDRSRWEPFQHFMSWSGFAPASITEDADSTQTQPVSHFELSNDPLPLPELSSTPAPLTRSTEDENSP